MADVVYLVRQGQRNEELRYSLRSLPNLTHDRLWIAGWCPQWLTPPNFIPVGSGGSRFLNTTRSLAAVCAYPEVSDRFYLFNDDMFVTRPTEEIPVYHRGLARDRLSELETEFQWGLSQTIRWMEEEHGIVDPLSYDIHYPLLVDKENMAKALSMRPNHIEAFHKRTFYGNLFGIGGDQAEDPKITSLDREPDPTMLVWSTDDRAFNQGVAGRLIRAAFPEPSPWESPNQFIDRRY